MTSAASARASTPTCGLTGASADWAVGVMQICREMAQALQDLQDRPEAEDGCGLGGCSRVVR